MSDIAIASPFAEASQGIQPLEPHSRAILRVATQDIAEASARLGVSLPTIACTSAGRTDLVALWLGPDEWLLIGQPCNTGWASDIAARVAGIACSLVDVGHRQVALEIGGPRAQDILAHGCALDLALPAFPVGMCTRTMYHKAEVVLWRKAEDCFHMEVWRSFARYVEALLRDAESELQNP